MAITKTISLENKAQLLEMVVTEEVILKRDANISAFRRGLSVLKFLDVCKSNCKLVAPLFVYDEQVLNAEEFKKLLKTPFSNLLMVP